MGIDLRAVAAWGDSVGVAGYGDRMDADGCSEHLTADKWTDWGCCDGFVGCADPVDRAAWDGCAV